MTERVTPHDAASPVGPLGPKASLGNVAICGHADALRLLNHASCRRETRTAMITGVLKAVGRDGSALVGISRLNLLNEDGPPHRQKRRFALRLIAEIAAMWDGPAVDKLVTELLDRAVAAGRADLHQDLSIELVCSIIGSRLGLAPASVLELQHQTVPIFESNFMPGLRLADFLRLAEQADKAAAIIQTMAGPQFKGREIDADDLPMLAALVTIPALPLLAEALTTTLLHLICQPALLPVMRADTQAIGPYLRETLRLEPPLRYTKPTRAEAAVTLSDGRELPAGSQFLCDIRSANRDPSQFAESEKLIPEGRDVSDLTFGAGPHRCPGAGLSLVVLKQAVATAIAGYQIELDGEVVAKESPVGRRHQKVPVRVCRRS